MILEDFISNLIDKVEGLDLNQAEACMRKAIKCDFDYEAKLIKNKEVTRVEVEANYRYSPRIESIGWQQKQIECIENTSFLTMYSDSIKIVGKNRNKPIFYDTGRIEVVLDFIAFSDTRKEVFAPIDKILEWFRGFTKISIELDGNKVKKRYIIETLEILGDFLLTKTERETISISLIPILGEK